MDKRVKPDELANAIMKELKTYDQKVTDGVKKEIRQVSKECRQDIVTGSPAQTGDYKAGWRDKVAYESYSDIRVRIFNKTDYQLTHLLEHGHAGPGGIAKGSARPFPHIGPAEQKAEQKLMKKVKVVVKKA
jgi:hypothetical protein